MKIDIFGGAGFIGTNLALELAKEHTVAVYDNLVCGDHNLTVLLEAGIHWNNWDIRDDHQLNETPDIIINLACPASPTKYKIMPEFTMDTCVAGTLKVLAHASFNNSYIIHASSSEIYGHVDGFIDEQVKGSCNSIGPRSMYAEGKRAAEAIISNYWAKGGSASILRIFNTYGPYMDLDDGRVIPSFIKNVLAEKPLSVENPGTQQRSFMYISDLVRAFKYLIENRPTDVYNVGNVKENLSINQLAALFGRLYGGFTEDVQGRAEEIMHRSPSISKIYDEFGWEPYVNLTNGIQRTMEWATSKK